MQENEGPRNPVTPESVWKSINEGVITMTTEELCKKVRELETRRSRVRWIAVLLAMACGIGFVYSVTTIEQGWIRLGWAWLYGAIGVLAWTLDRRWPDRMAEENCVVFLRREYNARRDRLLGLRRDMMLVILPAILASWWGGGPAATARNLGIRLLLAALTLAFIWHGYGKEAEKVKRDIEALPEPVCDAKIVSG